MKRITTLLTLMAMLAASMPLLARAYDPYSPYDSYSGSYTPSWDYDSSSPTWTPNTGSGSSSGSSGSGSGSSSGSSGGSSGSSDTSLRTPGGCLKSLVPSGTEEVLKDLNTHAIRYFSSNEVIPDLTGRSGGTEIYMKTGGTGAADYNHIVGKICYSGRDKSVGYIYPDQVKTAREEMGIQTSGGNSSANSAPAASTSSSAAPATPTDTRDVSDDTVLTIPEDKTEIYVDSSGAVYDAKTKARHETAYYDSSSHKIYYVNNGQTTNSTYGKMLTKTRGYINLDLRGMQGYNSATPSASNEVKTVSKLPKSNPFQGELSLETLEGKAAAYLYEAAVIGGYPDGTFKGERPVNRAEAAKFLLLASQTTVEEGAMNNGRFWDVVDGQWYTKFVMTAARKGVINGHPDGSFKPADTVNTAEFLKMMTKAFQLPENKSHKYVDVKEGDWFGAYAGLAAEYNLFPERSKVRLLPNQKLTRKEVAVAIYQFLSHE